MNNSPKISRRDWFRLRQPARETFVGGMESVAESANSGDTHRRLSSIEHPPNHDGMDLTQLPPLAEATLSEQDFIDLIGDIQRHAADVQLMQKRDVATSHATVDAASTLRTAQDWFLNGKVNRLQIRYRWQDSLWIDTLNRQPAGIRLVRISHDRKIP